MIVYLFIIDIIIFLLLLLLLFMMMIIFVVDFFLFRRIGVLGNVFLEKQFGITFSF